MAKQSNPRKVSKRGNSAHVSLPVELMADVGLELGDRVVIQSDGQTLTIQPVQWEVATNE
jgi:antitoxin component of MazEF toxin-antitoxin module